MDKKEQITPRYGLVPSKLGWSMKVIGKTRSGKSTFVSAFVEFLIKYIKTDFKIF